MSNHRERSILVGDSLGTESAEVLTTALALGQGLRAALHVVHAFAPPLPVGPPEQVAALQGELEERMRRDVERSLAEQTAKMGLHALAGSTAEVVAGGAYRALEEVERAERPDLLVLGAAVDGKRPWSVLASTVDRLLRQVSSPTWVVRPGAVFPPRRVLLATDLSPLSGGAVRSGCALLARAGIAPESVEALFVLDGAQAHSLTQFTPTQVLRFAAEQLERFVADHAYALPRVRRRVRVGDPRTELLEHLAAERPDLVVLGTHGHTGLDRLLLGSVAATLVREAKTSALVVPQPAARAALESRGAAADLAYVADWA